RRGRGAPMTRYDLVLRDGMLVSPEPALDVQAVERGVQPTDIAILDGRVAALAPELEGASAPQEIDARDLHIFPGVLDAHVHFNEPGRTEWEGFASGSRALAAGGATSYIEMPL